MLLALGLLSILTFALDGKPQDLPGIIANHYRFVKWLSLSHSNEYVASN